MFVVSLIAKPGGLEPALVEALRNAWGGGDAQWLSPDEAAEFEIPGIPDTFETARADIGGQGVDLNVLPAEGRRKRLLLADMDSTMIGQECIDELADEAGVGPRVAEITARAMNGELNFDAALKERVGLLKGLPETVIDKVLDERITYASGGKTLVATMKANGARCVLVSGGFTAFADRVAAELGFDLARANTLCVEDGALTGEPGLPILGKAAKVETLMEQADALGISPSDAAAIGDGANDLGMIEAAGLGVAVHAKPSVQAAAPLSLNHADLTGVLYLQGYSGDAFVTG